MRLNIVVAMSENAVIGKDGQLPWHLSADLKRFKALTVGHPIVMGRKTFESLGRALPDRKNIVITRQQGYEHSCVNESCLIVGSLKQAIDACLTCPEVMIIGGASVYSEALPLCSRMYLTEVHQQIDGDVSFPQFDPADWPESFRERISDDSDANFEYSFVIRDRFNDLSLPSSR